MEQNYLPSNIKVLREEARLSVEQFAEKVGVSVQTVLNWENGSQKVYTKDLLVICPILRISEEDILERNIKAEREDAYLRMKKGNTRKDFNWYYGNKNKVIFYLIPLILIPVAALLTWLIVSNLSVFAESIEVLESNNIEVPIILRYYYFFYPYFAATIVGSVFIIIEVIKRFRRYFRWWYILMAISFSTLLFGLLAIMLLPYYIYCIYQVFILKGKNRK